MTRPALIGDIGGTHARFALVTPGAVAPRAIQRLPCADYPDPIAAIHDYLARAGATGDAAPREACLAVAGPLDGERLTLTNLDWDVTRGELRQALGLTHLRLINDFIAQALGLPHVGEAHRVVLQAGEAAPRGLRLVIGPGTGLGMAGLLPAGRGDGRRRWLPLPSEGGHAAFAATDARERALLEHFRQRYGRVSVERLLSGPGLVELYLAHCALEGIAPHCQSPAEVTAAAGSGDGGARDTLLRFLKILGDVSGDAALTLGARGGVTLCGGILPRLLEWLPQSRFLEAFAAKGRMAVYAGRIPVQVVTDPWTGLLGAAEALHHPEIE
ncbi:glucokinase [Halomonas saccharevitans]|uniref:Glucokinase n=1 Tax=Halomonas saccharevitans TaxID=416872 RepID=A0A1I6ZB06_9GAMM|nr:glucokinase [Halomonas saccharevitans]SFT59877.1 glucokinase [Halomonas saccharevitans]